ETTISQVFGAEELLEMEQFARSIPIADDLRREVVHLVMATHPETDRASEEVRQYVQYGASPRAGQACILAAKIQALLSGRLHVSLEDILHVAPPVLRHRMILNFEAQADGKTSDSIIESLIQNCRNTRRNQP
ncbi:MAG: AAA family ATPase, partial [Puniceicoccales bacterium]